MSASTLWLPGRVEGGYKRRANCVWGSLVGLLVGYSVWVVYSAVDDRKTPTVSITIERTHYDFPDLSVCFYKGKGCDTEDIRGCADSPIDEDLEREAFATEANGFVVDGDATFIRVDAQPSESFANCVKFDLSQLQISDSAATNEPMVSLRLRWVSGVGIGNDDEADFYSKIVYVYFTDGAEALQFDSPGMPVPYNRFSGLDLEEAVVTSMNIKLTETRVLSGEKTKQYSASSLVNFEYEYTDGGWPQEVYDAFEALLLLEIRQPSLSHTILSENDPVQTWTIIGSIGGVWELLLILWGVAFITNTRASPDLKGRNFLKPARRLLSRGTSNHAGVPEDGSGRVDFSSHHGQFSLEGSTRQLPPSNHSSQHEIGLNESRRRALTGNN